MMVREGSHSERGQMRCTIQNCQAFKLCTTLTRPGRAWRTRGRRRFLVEDEFKGEDELGTEEAGGGVIVREHSGP